MRYVIDDIRIFMRETPSPRMDFAIGKGKSVFPKHARAIAEVSLALTSADGSVRTFGCAADWPSVGWLDKRPDLTAEQKMKALLSLVDFAGEAYLEEGGSVFSSPFSLWQTCHRDVLAEGRRRGLVDLCSAFASSLIERALIDAVCRLNGYHFLDALRDDLLKIAPREVHAELDGTDGYPLVPEDVPTTMAIRHTVGLGDPLTDADLQPDERVADGQPETLEEYIQQDGLTHFKLKVPGDVEAALQRLERIAAVISQANVADSYVTLDCNESYPDVDELERFTALLEERLPGFFARIALIEQPLPRSLEPDAAGTAGLKRIAQRKPLIIDEGDGHLDAFREAWNQGYSGVSHKNCKGVFKSLLNRLLCAKLTANGRPAIMSAEDLTHMPVVSLHQDFSVVAALGLHNAERNAHHYFLGLSHLQPAEAKDALQTYPSLYREKGGSIVMHIENGSVNCSEVFAAHGLGVAREPHLGEAMVLSAWAEKNVSG